MNLTKKKDKKCSHNIISEKLSKNSRAYFYCYKCGKLIIVKDLNIYETLNKEKLEFNPIKVVNQMILRQKEEIKTINEKLKTKVNDDFLKSNIYIKKRETFIFFLKQLCNKTNFKEKTFYHCLYLLDNYLFYFLKKDISKRTIFLILLGFFLISSKFTEDDIFEPKINKFCKFEKDIVVSQKEILNMEIKCLQIINYNVLNYSTYDWLKIFNRIGTIFNIESNKLKDEQIFEKQKYFLKKILDSDILYKFSSFEIALSIMHISMEKIFYENKINKELFELFLSIFNCKFSDYRNSYIDIKNIIFDYNKLNKEKYDINDFNNNSIKVNNKTESNKKPFNICFNKSVTNILKNPMQLSNLNDKKINKSRSKKLVIYLNDIIYKNKNKSEKTINILRKKIDNEEEKIKNLDNLKEEFKLNDLDSIYLYKNKLLMRKERKEKQHLTIDCNNIESIKNNKLNEINYNNIINYLLNKTKRNNIFNTKKFFLNNNSSRNYITNNEKLNIKEGKIKHKNEIKKSLTSLSNSPNKRNNENILNENKITLFYNLNHKNKSLLKTLNINIINNKKYLNNINQSIKTFYNKDQIKTFSLTKNILSSSYKNWKNQNNIFLRNTNNFFNSKNNNIAVNKEIIPSK